MKILHIVSGDLRGGAARGAYWLHQGLVSEHIDSKILKNTPGADNDSNVATFINSKKKLLLDIFYIEIENFPLRAYKNKTKHLFSTGIIGFDITKHPLYDWADIIHLHWINNAFINIKHLRKIKKPIVWTLRDMWPFTGGCHTTIDCDKYKTGCGSCPHLGSKKNNDLSRKIVTRKQKYIPTHMFVVGITPWISSEAKKSLIFKDFHVTYIYNNINCDLFFPVDKRIAIEALSICTDKKIVLVGALYTYDYFKGFDKFLQALKNLDVQKYFIIFFGRLNETVKDSIKFEYKNFGLISDDITLRLLYSAADVFVNPSLIESFGKTTAESMACGTPVVCFDATGSKYIVDHKVNGYRSEPYFPHDLSNGIEWVINNSDYNTLALNARKKVIENFDNCLIAKQYIELYKNILLKQHKDGKT